jgi:flagellar protein FlbD
MIEVTTLNGTRVYVNADHIESVEAQPDTVLVLANGKHILVREEVDEVVRRAVEYQRHVRSSPPATTSAAMEPED